MTRRYLVLASSMALWLFVLAIVVKTSVDRLSVPPWGNPIGDSLSPEVAGDTHVGQRFTAPFPGLYAIDVALDQATVTGMQQVTFHLKSDPAATSDLWTATFATNDLQEGVPGHFEFPRMQDSKGRTYYFYLESAESGPGDAIAARYGPQSILEGASAFVNGQPVSGNLNFQTYFSLRTREKAELLLTRMAEGRPYLLGTKGFYIGLAVVYALVLLTFLLQIARVILEEHQEGS